MGNKRKIVLYMTELNNDVLTKDVCIILFIMQKYHNYNSEIILTMGEEYYPDNQKFLDNMKISVVSEREEVHRRIAEADVLYIFGPYDVNLEAIEEYKRRNPHGKIYCKLDMNDYWLMSLAQYRFDWVKNFWEQCDLITVECQRLKYLIKLYWGIDTEYLPNGFYDFWKDDLPDYTTKSNIILTVGRLGEYQKNSDLLLLAFASIHEKIPDWKLIMVGSVEPDFEELYRTLVLKFPKLTKKVILTGKLSKEEVKEHFREAKVFCLPSRWEGCPNVLGESLGGGCYPLVTDFTSAVSLLKYGEYGTVIPIEDQFSLEDSLIRICNDEQLLQETSTKVQEYARTDINWVTLCGKIDKWLTD